MQHAQTALSRRLAAFALILFLLLGLTWPMTTVSHAAGGTWEAYTYSGTAGNRPYYVYTPAGYQSGTAVPLIVMLHGCSQNAADFAAGTGMNELADQKHFLVVYPQQPSTYNASSCWNWFDAAHQSRGSGEPAIISEIAKTVMKNTARWTVDAKRVYVAGLSAGGGMSAILGATYPDLFAGIGVHSGLEYKAATSSTSALSVMRNGGPDPVLQGQAAYNAMGSYARVMPTIVFQGTSDRTVYQVNGDQVVQQYMQTDKLASGGTYNASFATPSSTVSGKAAVTNGRSYTISRWNDGNTRLVQEYWKITSMGHAWSGGSVSGSYTDPTGPSASQAMYDFFLAHPFQ